MFVVLDTEVYVNYFLAVFRFESGNSLAYECVNDEVTTEHSLTAIVSRLQMDGCTLVTFNGIRYDLPILSYALNGATNAQLKMLSNKIIKGNLMPWMAEKHHGFTTIDIDHIDIINLLPLFESLKLYGARNHTKRLQDLPYDPDWVINKLMAAELLVYCHNDCLVTYELFLQVWPDIELRMKLGATYNQDLRSKSDAQIAEAVMKSEYRKNTGQILIKPIDAGSLPTHVRYHPPSFIRFDDEGLNLLVSGYPDPALNELLPGMGTETFELLANGKPKAPWWLKKKTVLIDDKRYAVGLGGLHSQNKSESYYSTPGSQLVDIDVASFYPRIILNNGYTPPHMGDNFTRIYEEIVKRRLTAKASGDKTTAEGLKITINGTYGKLGSPYSAVYSPELMLAVTFTGQLALLMLIEFMAQRGIQCVSANTDGITVMSKNDALTRQVVCEWENVTGFEMEYTHYKSIHFANVNNYFAMTMDGDIKKKGIFRVLARGKKHGLDKNPAFRIIQTAAMDYVLYGKSIDRTIGECQDISQFLSVRTVRGGAAKDGEYLGKAVRWYTSTDTDTAINYVTNGNQVAKTDSAMPMMNLERGMPDDIDLEWYAYEARQLVIDVGHYRWM